MSERWFKKKRKNFLFCFQDMSVKSGSAYQEQGKLLPVVYSDN